MPRLYELRDLIADPSSSDAYFQRDFDDRLQNSDHVRQIYARWESDLQGLDAAAWESLKNEVSPYLTRRQSGRGWEQMFNILNQAHAYKYLKGLGCSNIHFIPRFTDRTPDLEAVLGSCSVLCEVKTINISQDEVKARVKTRQTPTVRFTETKLKDGFFGKLDFDIADAKSQLHAYDSSETAQCYIYLNFAFDDFFAEYKEQYFQQIDEHLSRNPISGVQLVFHNDETAFYRPLTMKNALVVNAGEGTSA